MGGSSKVQCNENVFFHGQKIQLSSFYKYLSILMSSRLSWSPAQKTLSQQAEKAMFLINNINKECNYSFLCSNKLFDSCISTIVTYGSEIWGANVHNSIEDVLLKYCRQQLGVGSRTPTPAVLRECGRLCCIKCIKYWIKLINSSNGSLLNSCYKILFSLCNVGRRN